MWVRSNTHIHLRNIIEFYLQTLSGLVGFSPFFINNRESNCERTSSKETEIDVHQKQLFMFLPRILSMAPSITAQHTKIKLVMRL